MFRLPCAAPILIFGHLDVDHRFVSKDLTAMLQHLAASWLVAIALAAAALFSLVYVWKRFFSLQGLPKSLPWAGAERSPLSRARSTWRSFFGLRGIIQDGYYKVGYLLYMQAPRILTDSQYSKRDQAFVLPNLVAGAEVILPMSQMRWLLEQPDHVLNQNEVNREFLHADRTMLHPNVIRDTVHGHVIRREMTKDLDNYADAIVEEIDHSLELNWGVYNCFWTEVPVYDTMLDVISRISNRVLVGLPLCRDKEYLRSTSTFARNVVITAGMLNLLPESLRPLLSPVITSYDMYHYQQITKFIFPIVKARMAEFKPGMDYRNPDYSKHDDYIQWALHDAFSHDDPAERTPEMITKRLTVLSFAAIQSSVITITNALFDIASSPRSEEIQQALRAEVQEVVSRKGKAQTWKRAGLVSMTRIDSALRESMRVWGFISRGVMKKVVAKEGVTIPSGEHLPYGAKVGVTAYAIHHDESVYKNAFEFDAFRFSDPAKDGEKPAASQSLVTSSEQFMAFSHGRHAW
jgi:cytochrome P450